MIQRKNNDRDVRKKLVQCKNCTRYSVGNIYKFHNHGQQF